LQPSSISTTTVATATATFINKQLSSPSISTYFIRWWIKWRFILLLSTSTISFLHLLFSTSTFILRKRRRRRRRRRWYLLLLPSA
jgi:hypothetical protein